jgi:prevent-host-death family protein
MYNLGMNQLGQVSRDQAVAAVSDVRERLSEIVDEVSSTGSDIVITKHGRPAAVLLGFEDYESLIETVNILSDSAVMAALAEAENDLETGDLVPLD